MAKTVKTTFKLRRGTATEWLAANPILNQGEPGFEIDTNKLKIGNGMDRWNKLEYIAGEASEDASGGGAAEIYIGTTAPTGKYKLWINPEGEISEGGMGGTGDYGKEIKGSKKKIITMDENDWDFDFDLDTNIGYAQISAETTEEIMTLGETFSLKFKTEDGTELLAYEGTVKQTTIYADKELREIFYIGTDNFAEAVNNGDSSVLNGENYFLYCMHYDEMYMFFGYIPIPQNIEQMASIEFEWSTIDHVKLPANALTAGTNIKIDEENTQINCTVGAPIGVSRWLKFNISNIDNGYGSSGSSSSSSSSESDFAKIYNNYIYFGSRSYGSSSSSSSSNDTNIFYLQTDPYSLGYIQEISTPDIFNSGTSRQGNPINISNQSIYSTWAGSYQMYVDYTTSENEDIVITCAGIGDSSTQNYLIEAFENRFNNDATFFVGRYNTLTPVYEFKNGIVPEDDTKEAFLIIFGLESSLNYCYPILISDRILEQRKEGNKKIFSDGPLREIYQRLHLRGLSDNNNIFDGGDNLVIGSENIFGCAENNIVFGNNNLLSYGPSAPSSNAITNNIIFGNYNNIERNNYNNIVFGNSNYLSYVDDTIVFGYRNHAEGHNILAFGSYLSNYGSNILNIGEWNSASKSNIGIIGCSLSTPSRYYYGTNGPTLITGYCNNYSMASDIFQVGGGENTWSAYNAFGVTRESCYRQTYTSNGIQTYRMWDDEKKLPYMKPSATSVEVLIQALIDAGLMKGENE